MMKLKIVIACMIIASVLSDQQYSKVVNNNNADLEVSSVLVSEMNDETMLDGTNNRMVVDRKKEVLELPELWPRSWKIIKGIVAICATFSVLCTIFFLVAVITAKKDVRMTSYNLYLIFLIVPDLLLNTVSVVLSVFHVSGYNEGDGNAPHIVFYLLVWIWSFYFVTNFYLNGVIAYEIHSLVAKSHQRMKAAPPSTQRVCAQVALVYLFGAGIATWNTLQVPWSPLTIVDSQKGVTAFGSPSSTTKTTQDPTEQQGLFSKTGATLLSFGIILVSAFYVLYVQIRIWHGKLLPKNGKTRAISLYFARILVIFFGFYFPGLIAQKIRSDTTNPIVWYWSSIICNVLFFTQELTTLYMAATKDDIRDSISRLISKITGNSDAISHRFIVKFDTWAHTKLSMTTKPHVRFSSALTSLAPIRESVTNDTSHRNASTHSTNEDTEMSHTPHRNNLEEEENSHNTAQEHNNTAIYNDTIEEESQTSSPLEKRSEWYIEDIYESDTDDAVVIGDCDHLA